MSDGYTGLSFPIRIGNKGGLKMSTTSPTEFTHIEESIKQILSTSLGERVMELHFGSSISSHIFDPTDDSSYSLIKHEIVEALNKYEPRIEVTNTDITLTESIDDQTGKNFLYVTVQYKVIKYNRSGSVDVNLGGI